MSEKRMLIVPSELVKKIDENRGDMGQADFIEYLINNQFGEKNEKEEDTTKYATLEELRSFEQDVKKLMKNFLDFFVTYGLELGKPSLSQELEELTSKLQGLEKIDKGSDSDNEKRKATIKWK
jgi:hypothetical protein